MRSVCEHLDSRRLLTTEVYVRRPAYVRVEILGEVIVKDDADTATVKRAIEEKLCRYFDPLEGGENGRGWPFGGAIYYSRVYRQVFVEGVDRITTLAICVDGQVSAACQDVELGEGVLTYSTGHGQIQVRYGWDQG